MGRQWGLERADSLEFLFRRHYNLAPTDPRYLDCSAADIVVDLWAHRFLNDPKLRDESVDADYDAEVADMEAEALARDATRAAGVAPAPETAPEGWEPVVVDQFEASP